AAPRGTRSVAPRFDDPVTRVYITRGWRSVATKAPETNERPRTRARTASTRAPRTTSRSKKRVSHVEHTLTRACSTRTSTGPIRVRNVSVHSLIGAAKQAGHCMRVAFYA